MFHPRFPVAAAAGFFTAALACGSSAVAQSSGASKKAPGSLPAHADGVASLQVVVDGDQLKLDFYSPWGLVIEPQLVVVNELPLLGAVVGVGLLASLIPGYRAYKLSLADGLTPRI